jgi:hypothetical protein
MINKALILALSLFGTYLYADDALILYSSVAKEWKIQIATAFDKAEKEVYNVVVVPDEDIFKPDPDVKKCACRGSGIIVHGDGHKTPCEFHGRTSTNTDCPDGKCPLVAKNKIVSGKTTCQCETRCGCKICNCNKMEIK